MWPNHPDQRGGYSNYSNPPPRAQGRFRPRDMSHYGVQAPSYVDPPPRGAESFRSRDTSSYGVEAPNNAGRPFRNSQPSGRLPLAAHLRQRQAQTQGNGPFISDLAYRPAQAQSSTSRIPGAPCPACYNMNPRLQPAELRTNPKLDPYEMKIYLKNFVEESDKCPFCDLLHRIFLEFVNGAEDKIKLVMKSFYHSSLGKPEARVVVEPDQPVVITFREGIHTKVSIARDDIVNEGEKKDPERSYYPLPIQVYSHTRETIPGWPSLGILKDPEEELDESFQFFTDKLNDCRRYHTECRQGDSTLPTRLLYIGSSDGNAIRLVESDEILSYRPLYAAVSHRWVRDPTWMLRTLNQNYKDHLQSISLVKCPGVLQDAVRVTRALGVDYLWMDTLCLIQDSSTDKAKEIGKMGDYYRNAYFTIAASSSKTTLVPFTNRRDPYYKPHLFPFGKNGNSAVHARRLGVEGFLAKRGWIWQESALSVRMLNFAPSELIWECRQEVESECGYEPKPFPSLGLAQKYLDIGEEPFKLWQDLVQTYSTRTFGDFTDFLPGISGLAKRIQDQTGSAYHAGMWKMDMVPSLLWEVTRGFDRVKEPRPTVPEPSVECKAPSWSWASVEGRIRTSDTDIRNSCRPAGYSPSLGGSGVDGSFSNMTPDIPEPEVEGLEQLTPNSSFGKVAGGLLIIKGRLIPVRLTYSRGRDGIWTYQLMLPGEHDSGIGFSPDTELEPFPRWSQAQNRTVRRTNEILTTGFSVTVHCLRIATWPGAPNQRLTDDGLVLGRSEDNNNYFKRIGYFSFDNSSHFDYVLPQPVTIS